VNASRGKQRQLLKEVAPRLTIVAVLWNPTGPALELNELEVAARTPDALGALQNHQCEAPR